MFDSQNDASPREPDEPDPETTDAPEIPSVETPDTAEEVPAAVAQAFWSIVITVNLGVLAVSLGLLVLYFRGWWRLGGGGVVLGVVLLGYGYLKYRVAEPLTERGV